MWMIITDIGRLRLLHPSVHPSIRPSSILPTNLSSYSFIVCDCVCACIHVLVGGSTCRWRPELMSLSFLTALHLFFLLIGSHYVAQDSLEM